MLLSRLVDAVSNRWLSSDCLDNYGAIDYTNNPDLNVATELIHVNDSKIVMLVPGEIGILTLDGGIEFLIDEESSYRIENYLS